MSHEPLTQFTAHLQHKRDQPAVRYIARLLVRSPLRRNPLPPRRASPQCWCRGWGKRPRRASCRSRSGPIPHRLQTCRKHHEGHDSCSTDSNGLKFPQFDAHCSARWKSVRHRLPGFGCEVTHWQSIRPQECLVLGPALLYCCQNDAIVLQNAMLEEGGFFPSDARKEFRLQEVRRKPRGGGSHPERSQATVSYPPARPLLGLKLRPPPGSAAGTASHGAQDILALHLLQTTQPRK